MNTRDRVSFYDLSLTAIIALFICRTRYSHDNARNAGQMCAPAEAYLRKEDSPKRPRGIQLNPPTQLRNG